MPHKIHSKFLIIFILGFASGLPLALVGNTLQNWYTTAGIDIVGIAALALVGQPYVYKFLWAPFFDAYQIKGGRRRGFLLLIQVCLIGVTLFMSLFDPKHSPYLLAGIAFVMASISASLDTIIDAYRTEILSDAQAPTGVSLHVAGYRLGMILSGSVALIVADSYGWIFTYRLMALCMLPGLLVSIIAQENPAPNVKSQSLSEAVLAPLKQLLAQPYALGLIAMIILYKFAEALTYSISPVINVFLLREMAFSLTIVGSINKGFGLVANLLGVFLGGYFISKRSLYWALVRFGIIQAFANLSYLALYIIGKQIWVLTSVIAIDNFCAGMGTAAVIALIMRLCDRRYTATQFALLTAVAALARVYLSPMAGVLAKHLGWYGYFIATFFLAWPAVFLLLSLRQAPCFNGISQTEVKLEPV